MEKHSDITYTLSKRKLSDDHSEASLNSSESMLESLSTSMSSHSSFACTAHDEHPAELSLLISTFPMNKNFSRSLQQQISKASPPKLKKLLKTITPNMPNLMVDPYGNYICQTIFHSCSAEQRLKILYSLKGHIENIAYSPRGTHSLQNLISLASLIEEEKFYFEELKGKIANMSRDINASHVVQKLLSTLDSSYFIVKELKNKVKDLATDKFGVCVLKKCINNPEIMSEIIGNALFLMQHPFGNYSVQYVIEGWGDETAFDLYSCIKGKITQLCLQKFASNVIEKAIKVEALRECIVKEIFIEDKFKELILNQYGCFVLRTFSKFCAKNTKQILVPLALKTMQQCSFPKLQPLWKDILEELGRF